MGRAHHVSELDLARCLTRCDVEREHHREQHLVLVPIDVEGDVDPWAPRPHGDVRDQGRRTEPALDTERGHERTGIDDLDRACRPE